MLFTVSLDGRKVAGVVAVKVLDNDPSTAEVDLIFAAESVDKDNTSTLQQLSAKIKAMAAKSDAAASISPLSVTPGGIDADRREIDSRWPYYHRDPTIALRIAFVASTTEEKKQEKQQETKRQQLQRMRKCVKDLLEAAGFVVAEALQ